MCDMNTQIADSEWDNAGIDICVKLTNRIKLSPFSNAPVEQIYSF